MNIMNIRDTMDAIGELSRLSRKAGDYREWAGNGNAPRKVLGNGNCLARYTELAEDVPAGNGNALRYKK